MTYYSLGEVITGHKSRGRDLYENSVLHHIPFGYVKAYTPLT